MTGRFFAAVFVVFAVMLLAAGAAHAQSDAAPRTAWGAPDLQGVWDFRSLTPMQRPEQYGADEVLTAEEAAAFSQEVIASRSRDSETSDRAARAAQGDIIPYNDFWFDEGTAVTRDRAFPHRGPARRAAAGVYGGQAPPARRAGAGPPGRIEPRADAGRLRRGPGAGRPAGALHPRLQLRAADGAQRLQQQRATVPDRGPRGAAHRDGPRRAHRAAGRATHPARGIAPMAGRFARLLGRRHAGRGNRRTSCARRTSCRTRPAGHLKLTERFTRVDADTLLYRVTVDDPTTWTRTLDLRGADAAESAPAVRVRLPRRQLRAVQHPLRRTLTARRISPWRQGSAACSSARAPLRMFIRP